MPGTIAWENIALVDSDSWPLGTMSFRISGNKRAESFLLEASSLLSSKLGKTHSLGGGSQEALHLRSLSEVPFCVVHSEDPQSWSSPPRWAQRSLDSSRRRMGSSSMGEQGSDQEVDSKEHRNGSSECLKEGCLWAGVQPSGTQQ